MKFIYATLLCGLMIGSVQAQSLWQTSDPGTLPKNLGRILAKAEKAYLLDEAGLKGSLANAGSDATTAVTVALPLANGTFRNFKLWRNTLMPKALAEKYPAISTYTGQAEGNATITVKADFTVYGFHAMIFDGANTTLTDPYDLYGDALYIVRLAKDETKPAVDRMKCANGTADDLQLSASLDVVLKPMVSKAVINGAQLRTYRLALSADEFYCQAATGLSSPSIAQCLSAMTTTMNRVNGVYEREFSVTMQFVAKEDTLIWPTLYSINGKDTFSAIDGSPSSCVAVNQYVCDSIIGSAHYDIGHVFTTGAGGESQVACVCQTGLKAQSVTGQATPVGDGFDINYVAHEMGHEFGAEHSFNDNMSGSCSGNAVSQFAYEPGSGTTIMCYAGICAPDDIQPNSDAYFSAISLLQIRNFINTTGDGCAAKTATENLPVHVDSFSASYSIPYLTPFELTAPVAIDSTTDTSTTYCWEQWNLGDFGKTFATTHLYGPIFRSIAPTAISSTRVFPNAGHVAAGILSDAGIEDAQGEKVPDQARYLTFKLSVRDIYLGNGCFLIPDDTIHLDVINTGTGFSVTSQNAMGTVYLGGTSQTITWNVASTPSAPIGAAFVDIFMSVDGGYSWAYHLGTFENTGSATVVVPNPPVTVGAVRFKVKGHKNVFFNVNTTNFTVENNPALPISTEVGHTVAAPAAVHFGLYPNPTSGNVYFSADNLEVYGARVYDILGRQVWNGRFTASKTVRVADWPKGTYAAVFSDDKQILSVKQFSVE